MVEWVGQGVPGLMVIPRNPTPVGLELHTLCDSQSGIMLNFEVYEGKETMAKKEFVNEKTDIGIIHGVNAALLEAFLLVRSRGHRGLLVRTSGMRLGAF